jgi:L-iditol 2-dehydrogenase
VRAVVLDAAGQPALAEVPEPDGDGELVRVLACGLCGSDVEKLGDARPGTVLGHEVVAELQDGRRVALVHHLPCGECARCRAGHESTCDAFPAPTIVPGGFAERVRARAWVDLPAGTDEVVGTFVEPLACVLRGVDRVPGGRVLVAGLGFMGRLFLAALRLRGDEVFALEPNPERRVADEPDGPVDAAVVCAPAPADEALGLLKPGGTLLVFAPGAATDLDLVYRRELHVLGSRSATPESMQRAVELLPRLELPPPHVLPLARFGEGLDLYRSGRELKVVFTP